MNIFPVAGLFRSLCVLPLLVGLAAPCAAGGQWQRYTHDDHLLTPTSVPRTVPVASGGRSQARSPEAIAAQYAPDLRTANESRMPLMEANGSLQLHRPHLTPPPMRAGDVQSVFTRVFVSTAHAAGPSERVVTRAPNQVTAKINPLGPEAWPIQESLDTSTQPRPATSAAPATQALTPPASAPQTGVPGTPPPSATQPVVKSAPPAAAPAPPAPAQEMPASAVRERATPSPQDKPTANATRPVIYVDDAGRVVPKPPEPEKMIEEAEKLLESTRYLEALAKLEEVKALTISRELREKVLYLISDAVDALYADKPLEGFEPVLRATSEALNANLRSPMVPAALFRLGMTHTRVNNFNEAEGYFRALKRRFPGDPNVPVAFTNLGNSLLAKGFYAQAATMFRIVVQEYPESQSLRTASVGLVKALYRQGDLAQALVIADFVEKRWPRYYLTDTSFLRLLADMDTRLSRYEPALQLLWLYYNLDPNKPNIDTVLAAIGDLYLRTGRIMPAMDVFADILKRFPDTPGAEIALLRMAEKGIHDGRISEEEMFKVFANPGTPIPPVAYREIMSKWKHTPGAALAQLKLAMWQLWDKQYTEAMGTAADFIDAHPESENVDVARNVIFQGFMAELKHALTEENYGRILVLWNGFPLVRERYGPIDPALRNALARGYLERGDEKAALDLMAEFLKTPKNPQYSDGALALYFNKYLQAGDWNALLDLGELVKGWDMTPAVRGQMDYAMALSAQNLGLDEKAVGLWKKLEKDENVPAYQQAYAAFFLARDAERRKDIKDAYAYNKRALDLFTRLEQERSDKADPQRVKESVNALMDITEVANRIPEALEWVERYNEFVPENSPEYPGLRFREARLYRKLGDTAKAKALLEQIIKASPDSPFAKAATAELRTFEVSRDLRTFMPQQQ